MAAHAGERAQKTGVFHCAHCSEAVHVNEGDKITQCPNGHKTYESRTGGPGTKG